MKNSQVVAHDTKWTKLIKSKVKEFMLLTLNINYTLEDPLQSGYDYLNDVIIYLETLAKTTQEILPLDPFDKVISGVLEHISNYIVSTRMYSDSMYMLWWGSMQIWSCWTIYWWKVPKQWIRKMVKIHQFKSLFNKGATNCELIHNSPTWTVFKPIIQEKNYFALDSKKVIQTLIKKVIKYRRGRLWTYST